MIVAIWDEIARSVSLASKGKWVTRNVGGRSVLFGILPARQDLGQMAILAFRMLVFEKSTDSYLGRTSPHPTKYSLARSLLAMPARLARAARPGIACVSSGGVTNLAKETPLDDLRLEHETFAGDVCPWKRPRQVLGRGCCGLTSTRKLRRARGLTTLCERREEFLAYSDSESPTRST